MNFIRGLNFRNGYAEQYKMDGNHELGKKEFVILRG